MLIDDLAEQGDGDRVRPGSRGSGRAGGGVVATLPLPLRRWGARPESVGTEAKPPSSTSSPGARLFRLGGAEGRHHNWSRFP